MLNIVTSPQVLTDIRFTRYGGKPGTSTDDQRMAAYAIAESIAAQEIGTFLAPTRVTGSYSWPPMGQPLQLEHDRIRGIVQVVAVLDAGCDCAQDAIELTGCAWIKDQESAIIDVRQCGSALRASCAGCYGRYSSPYQARIVYDAGLPTGTWEDARLLQALTVGAQIFLDQMIDPESGEGGAGNPGVKNYSSLGYSETHIGGKMTAFGASARANFAAKLLEGFKVKSPMKLGW